MSNLLFFRRSLATRHAAVETMRQARAMPPGPERRATHQFARALSDLAKTEAWLDGQMPRQRASVCKRDHPGRAVGPEAEREHIAGARRASAGREPRSLFGET